MTLAVFLCGCASTSYSPVSKSPVLSGGDGKVVHFDKIDIWQHGKPSRAYRVVGMIEDRRPGIYSPDPSLETQDAIFKALAAKAHQAKADGVIVVSQFHATEERTTYDYRGMTGPEYHYETNEHGKETLVKSDPMPIEIPNGSEQVETNVLQTRAETIVYVSPSR